MSIKYVKISFLVWIKASERFKMGGVFDFASQMSICEAALLV